MPLENFFDSDLIIPNLRSNSNLECIVELLDHLVLNNKSLNIEKKSILTLLEERESQSSTAIGHGVAIPHAKLDNILIPYVIFGRSIKGIDFYAMDRSPVHFIILCLTPKKDNALHLNILSSISKTFKSSNLKSNINEAKSCEEIFNILNSYKL